MTGIYDYAKGLQSDAVTTVIGQSYTLSFDIGNYVPYGPSTVGMSINGGLEQLFINPSLAVTVHTPLNWMHFSTVWVADATSMQVSFLGRANGANSNNGAIGLDNAAFIETPQPPVTGVPEPVTLSLLGAGLAGRDKGVLSYFVIASPAAPWRSALSDIALQRLCFGQLFGNAVFHHVAD